MSLLLVKETHVGHIKKVATKCAKRTVDRRVAQRRRLFLCVRARLKNKRAAERVLKQSLTNL